MRCLNPQDLVQGLEWRYAVKHFDRDFSLTDDVMQALEASLQLAPSAFGLQPWRFWLVQNPEIRKQLRTVSWNQPQITDASALVVFAMKNDLGAEDVERFIHRIAEVRDQSPESLSDYHKMMLGFMKSKNPSEINQWSARQVYIALGFLLASAAQLGLDACPMEGIACDRYDQILGLDGYHTLCAAAIGKRDPADPAGKLKKVRYPKADLITHL